MHKGRGQQLQLIGEVSAALYLFDSIFDVHPEKTLKIPPSPPRNSFAPYQDANATVSDAERNGELDLSTASLTGKYMFRITQERDFASNE
jgi:hypothetical protein